METLNLIPELWGHHRHVLYLVAGWYVFNCAVQAMPKPNGIHGLLYAWIFAFLQGVAGNIGLLAKWLRPAPDEQVAVEFRCVSCGVEMKGIVLAKAGSASWAKISTRCSECLAEAQRKLL